MVTNFCTFLVFLSIALVSFLSLFYSFNRFLLFHLFPLCLQNSLSNLRHRWGGWWWCKQYWSFAWWLRPAALLGPPTSQAKWGQDGRWAPFHNLSPWWCDKSPWRLIWASKRYWTLHLDKAVAALGWKWCDWLVSIYPDGWSIVRCFEELWHERRLGGVLRLLRSTPFFDSWKDQKGVIGFPVHIIELSFKVKILVDWRRFWTLLHDHVHCVVVDPMTWNSSLGPAGTNWFTRKVSLVGDRLKCCRIPTSPTPVLAYSSNFVVDGRFGAFVVWHVALVEFVTMLLVRFLHTAEQIVVVLLCYDSRMGQGVLVPWAADISLGVDHYGFMYLVVGFALDSAFAYSAYSRSEEIGWSYVHSGPCVFPYGFAEGGVNDLVNAVVPQGKRDASGALGSDRPYHARAVSWALHAAHRCSLVRFVSFMRAP